MDMGGDAVETTRPRGVRADARRNIERLEEAAAEVFGEQGLRAPLEAIARRAGVSTGTIYNRFGSREALIDAVVPKLVGSRLAEAAERALASADAWDGFASYVEQVCELQASNQALNDLIARDFPVSDMLNEVCHGAQEQSARIVERARAAGSLRADFTDQDLLFVFWSNAVLVRFTAQAAPDAWRRGLAFTLDGLRSGAAHPLPTEALTPEQVEQVLTRLGRTSL
jgi:AcrR family transcriptional regulator